MMQNDDNFERRKSATVSSLVMTSGDDDDDKSRAGRVDERVRDLFRNIGVVVVHVDFVHNTVVHNCDYVP